MADPDRTHPGPMDEREVAAILARPEVVRAPPDDLRPVPADSGVVARPAVDRENLPRGPPPQIRQFRPLDRNLLDSDLAPPEGYAFAVPLVDPDAIPAGGFRGPPQSIPIHRQSGGTELRDFPGAAVLAPDGSRYDLGELLGSGATATVFSLPDDPTRVLRLVDFTESNAAMSDLVGRAVGEAIERSDGTFRLTRRDQMFVASDPVTGRRWLATIEENIAVAGDGITNARDRFAQRPPSPEEELTMALAIREMNNRGVVWTDHKPVNFDILPDAASPTGYRMLIFDTGGIRPATGLTAESRAVTARELQRLFDTSPRFATMEFQLHMGNARISPLWLDHRPFPADQPPSYTPGLLFRPDRYLDFAAMPEPDLLDYARALLGRPVDLPVAPP
ncbi:MAG: hypothetical protein ACK4YT_13165 [Sphingomonas sp.]